MVITIEYTIENEALIIKKIQHNSKEDIKLNFKSLDNPQEG